MDPNIASDVLEKTNASGTAEVTQFGFVEASPPRPPLGGGRRGHFFSTYATTVTVI
jgi:hypothetical protein